MELRGFGKDKKKRTWYMKRPDEAERFYRHRIGRALLAVQPWHDRGKRRQILESVCTVTH